MRTAASLVRYEPCGILQQVCRFAQVAVAKTASYAESVPDALAWKGSLSQLQQTQVRHQALQTSA